MDAIEISIQLWNRKSRGYHRGGVVAFLMVFVVGYVFAQGSVFQTDSAKTRSHI